MGVCWNTNVHCVCTLFPRGWQASNATVDVLGSVTINPSCAASISSKHRNSTLVLTFVRLNTYACVCVCVHVCVCMALKRTIIDSLSTRPSSCALPTNASPPRPPSFKTTKKCILRVRLCSPFLLTSGCQSRGRRRLRLTATSTQHLQRNTRMPQQQHKDKQEK